jgi:hypothetical protein
MTAEKKKAQQDKNRLSKKTMHQAESLGKAAKQNKKQKNNIEEKAPGQRHRSSCKAQENKQRIYEEMSQG